MKFALDHMIRINQKKLERDIPEILDPLRKKNLQDKLNSAKHVLVDFTMLDKLEFPESRAYLRELKEEIERELEQERQSNKQ